MKRYQRELETLKTPDLPEPPKQQEPTPQKSRIPSSVANHFIDLQRQNKDRED